MTLLKRLLVLSFLLPTLAFGQLIPRDFVQPGLIFCEDDSVGGTDTWTCATPTPELKAYDQKIVVVFTPLANNIAAATLKIGTLAAITIVAYDGTTLTDDAFVAGRKHILTFNGTNF